MRRTILRTASAWLALSLAACGGASNPPPAQGVAATPGTAASRGPLTGPPGCTRPIAEYEAIVDHDVTTGYLSQSVYDRINAELAGPRGACAAGREADARAQLSQVKTSHGYR
jgi:hypothetical protein